MPKYKTPSYTLKAQRNYLSKFDSITLRLPKGYKERGAVVGLRSADMVAVLVAEIERRERENGITKE